MQEDRCQIDRNITKENNGETKEFVTCLNMFVSLLYRSLSNNLLLLICDAHAQITSLKGVLIKTI